VNKAQRRNKDEIWRCRRITKHVVTAASQSIVCCRCRAVIWGVPRMQSLGCQAA
jgi:hypothetical protein